MRKNINYYFLGLSVVLMVFGILYLANLSAPSSLKIFGNTNYYLFHQLYAFGIGLVLGFAAFKVPLHFIRRTAPVLLIINLILLVAVFLPMVGVEFWGAKRWISIGKNTLQPSEFLKVTSVLYLAAWLSKKFPEDHKKGFLKRGYENFRRVFLPFLFFLFIISAILFFQKDLGTLGIIAISLITVYFVAGTPVWHIIFIIITSIAGALAFVRIEPYRVHRFLVFLNPEIDPLGIGFQIRQSLMAIGSGGILGRGLGMSTQKFGFLPQAMSDSVFAILGEETGIIGCSILILAFVLFFWQGFKIAKLSSDKFSKFAATGITTWIMVQTFMNISSAIGLFPLTGIPLPFFSYGGSHLIAEMIGVGILLNISKNS